MRSPADDGHTPGPAVLLPSFYLASSGVFLVGEQDGARHFQGFEFSSGRFVPIEIFDDGFADDFAGCDGFAAGLAV